MINFIRTNKSTVDKFLNATEVFWNDDLYLKPVEHENWLMFDFDSVKISSNSQLSETRLIELLQRELKEKNMMLEQAYNDMKVMKETFENTVGKEINQEEERNKYVNRNIPCVASIPLQEDEGYFSTYSHFGIHHDMLSDEVRTESYRDAILRNSESFKGKTVLDLGCGTSILSMFSSKAGAKEVIGVDQSDIIYHAMDIIRKNKYENIKLVKGRIEDTELPVEKVDIIVSEWMGYFLLFEGMLDSVIYARNRYLNEGGLMLPNRCTISIVGFGDEKRYNDYIDFWNNVYGHDMSSMKPEVLREASVEVCNPKYILTAPNDVGLFDLMTVDVDCPNFSSSIKLIVKETGKLTSIVGYFDTFFDLPETVQLSTSPVTKATHWKQVVFYLDTPIPVTKDQEIVGNFHCERNKRDVRSLSVIIEIFNKKYTYVLN